MIRHFGRPSVLARRAGSRASIRVGERLVEHLEPRHMLAVDLTITAITFSGTAFDAGSTVNATATYRNLGNTAATAFFVRFVASIDNVYGNQDDRELFEGQIAAGLGAGQTLTPPVDTFQLSTALEPGQYFVIGKIDSELQIAESNENNNVFVRPGTVTINGPDLSIQSVNLTGTTFIQGNQATAQVTIRNGGTEFYAGPLGARFVASINNIFGDADDVELFNGDFNGASIVINAGQTLVNGVNLNIPLNLASRQYFVLGLIDSNANATESNEGNNIFVRLGQITVTPPPRADLQITNVGALTSVQRGTTVNVSNTIRNAGNLAVGGAIVRYFLSPDANFNIFADRLLRTQSVVNLGAGASQTGMIDLVFPADLNPGTFYLFAVADPDNLITESNENNNIFATAAASVAVNGDATAADITVTSVTVASTMLPATTLGAVSINLTSTVRSQFGPSDIIGTGAYLSRDRIAGNADDIFVGQYSSDLQAGQSETRNVIFTLPGGVAPGAYNLLMRTDIAVNTDERNEGNNFLFGPSVTVPTPADLTINFVPTPGTIARGGFITGTLTLRNSGQSPAGIVDFVLGVSTDAVIDGADPDLFNGEQTTGGNTRLQGLDPNQTLTIPNFRIPVPLAFSPGSYRVWGRVDTAGAVPESNEGNNTFITAAANVTISNVSPNANPVQPDFAVTTVAPTAGQYLPGQTIKGHFVLSNFGATGPEPVVRAYLSSNNTLDTATDFLLSASVLSDTGSPVDPGSLFLGGRLEVPHFVPAGTYFLIVDIEPGSELSTTNNRGVSSAAVITIVRPTVSVTAADALAAEVATGAANGGRFTFTRTGPLTQPLNVSLGISGNALNGGDYSLSGLEGNTLFFSPGQATVTVTLNVTPDGLAEGAEVATLLIGRGQGYNVDVMRRTASVTIGDNQPVVSIRGGAATTEGSTATGSFTLSRTGPTTQALDVLIQLGGSVFVLPDIPSESAADVNFTPAAGIVQPFLNPGTVMRVTIPAGQASRTFSYSAFNDLDAEGPETLVATVIADGSNTYIPSPSTAAGGNTATNTVNDNDSFFSITAGAAITEGSATQGVFTITRTGSLAQALTLRVGISGTASFSQDDFDFVTGDLLGDPTQAPSGELIGLVDFAAGQATRTVRITTANGNDTIGEGTETVRLDLDPINDLTVGVTAGRGTATLNINDNEPVVSMTGAGTLSEGSTGFFTLTLSRTGPTTNLLGVEVQFSGDALDGDDFVIQTNANVTQVGNHTFLVFFEQGRATQTVRLMPENDDDGEGGESFTARLISPPNPTFQISPTQNTVRGTLTDNEAVVTVTATGASEGTPTAAGRITFTRTGGVMAQPLDVAFQYGDEDAVLGTDFNFAGTASLIQVPSAGNGFIGIVRFAAGAATATIEYFAVNDNFGEGPELFEIEIDEDNAPGARYSSPVGRDQVRPGITDNETFTLVSVRATDAAGAETAQTAAPNTLTYTFTRNRAGAPLTVNFELEGGAVEGVDYQPIALQQVTFGATELTKTITITPIADNDGEGLETVSVRIEDGAGYFADPLLRVATGNITNAVTPVVRLFGSLDVSANPVYSLSQPFNLISATVNVFNAGGLDTGSITGTLRLSLDDTLGNADDIIIGSRTRSRINAGLIELFEFDADIDGFNIPLGTYRIGFLAVSGTTKLVSEFGVSTISFVA